MLTKPWQRSDACLVTCRWQAQQPQPPAPWCLCSNVVTVSKGFNALPAATAETAATPAENSGTAKLINMMQICWCMPNLRLQKLRSYHLLWGRCLW
mmetsp:Transcript_59277/g.117461  ORF Transcript_59277/g.117461 Transcript_59277/m.117461 type:complete len:96 (+) Transcript_59277:236-523(+)